MVSQLEAPRVSNPAEAWVVAPQERVSRWTEIPNPSLYLMNVRVFLQEQSDDTGRQVRLIDVSDDVWRDFAENYDGIWFMGIYKPSEAARVHALGNLDRYKPGMPNLTEEGIAASPFSIATYEPNPDIAKDWEEWDEFRKKLNNLGIAVFGDFVPNHVALDHPWTQHPEYFIEIEAPEDGRTPDGFYRCVYADGTIRYFAHGKDPNNDPWLDTLQLNYSNPELQQAMIEQLSSLVPHFDGVRADMAMLVRAETFRWTWGWLLGPMKNMPGDFWTKARAAVNARSHELGTTFSIISEAYWLKDELIGEGIDRVYAKDLWDLLVEIVKKKTLGAWDSKFIQKLIACSTAQAVVFTENHDEHRVIEVYGGKQQAKAVTVLLAFLGKSAFMVHHGQEYGFESKLPMQVKITAGEERDEALAFWYKKLLALRRMPLVRDGTWSLEWVRHASDGDNHGYILGQKWRNSNENMVVCTNLLDSDVKAHVPIPDGASNIRVLDLDTMEYLKPDDIAKPNGNGLYIELAPFHSQAILFDAA